MKFTQGGMPVAKFSIATNERFKDKDGNWQDRTEWHNIVAFQKLAEIIGQYLKKGGKCYIEGSLRTGSWDDKETGKKMYKTEIIANDLVLLSGRGEGGGGGEYAGGSRGIAASSAATALIRARPNQSTRRSAVLRSRTKIFRSRSFRLEYLQTCWS